MRPIGPINDLKRGGSGNDFDDLVCNRSLANAVHVERQTIDQLTRILRRGIHRRHARACSDATDSSNARKICVSMRRGRSVLNISSGRLLVNVINQICGLLCFRFFCCRMRNRQQLFQHDPL